MVDDALREHPAVESEMVANCLEIAASGPLDDHEEHS
jgi:hypothetical protein